MMIMKKTSNICFLMLNITFSIRDGFGYGQLQVFSSYTCLIFQL